MNIENDGEEKMIEARGKSKVEETTTEEVDRYIRRIMKKWNRSGKEGLKQEGS